MSAKFIDIPADEWEQTYCAEELAAERKADKKERERVSALAFALTSLLEAGGVSRGVFQAVHIILSKSRYRAPDEPMIFSERDAGALLPGDPDVAYGSLRKRFVRAWGEIEAEQSRTGKRFCGRREKGSIQLASRKADAKKKAPAYFSQIAQAVLEVQREADRLRGKRDDRFRRAALMVWAKLPAFTEADITIFLDKPAAAKEQETKDSEPKHSRRLDRFTRVTEEMLTEAKKQDDRTVTATAKMLAVELGNRLAKALGVEPESALRLLADTLTEAADAPVLSEIDSLDLIQTGQSVDEENIKVRATSENENLHFSEQNEVSQCFTVDRAVHVEGEAQDFPDFPTWHEQNRERVAQWCDSDTEKWQMYEAEKALAADGRTVEDLLDSIHSEVKPTAFRHIDEQEKRKGKGDVIYAEEFTV
jgi:hypothetical protein